MTPEEITAHLDLFREIERRRAHDEQTLREKEEAAFSMNCRDCERVLRVTVIPLLERLADLLQNYGHECIVETEHGMGITDGFKKPAEYAASISVKRSKGNLVLNVFANPSNRQVSATLGIPHGNCSSIFQAAGGPLNEAEETTNRGITDFVIAAFPTRPSKRIEP